MRPKGRVATLVRLAAIAAVVATLARAESVRLRPEGAIYADHEGNGLSAPQGVACREGELAVADSGHGRVVLYDVTDDSVRARAVVVLPELTQPLSVGFLADGDVVVLDGGTRRIGRVSAAGEFRGWLEPDAGAFEPWSLAVGPHDGVHVVDLAGRRVVVIDAAGAVSRTIALPAECRYPSGVAVDRRGDVYVVDSVGRQAYAARAGETAFAPIGTSLAADLDFPTGIAVDDEGRLYVLDGHGGGVVILGRDGTFHGRQLAMGWKEGLLRYPSAACADGHGSVFVADRGNSRVQRFRVL